MGAFWACTTVYVNMCCLHNSWASRRPRRPPNPQHAQTNLLSMAGCGCIERIISSMYRNWDVPLALTVLNAYSSPYQGLLRKGGASHFLIISRFYGDHGGLQNLELEVYRDWAPLLASCPKIGERGVLAIFVRRNENHTMCPKAYTRSPTPHKPYNPIHTLNPYRPYPRCRPRVGPPLPQGRSHWRGLPRKRLEDLRV